MRLDDYTRRRMDEQAGVFFKRLQHTNPFPVVGEDAYDTYISLLPEHIRESLLALTGSAYASALDLNMASSLGVILDREEQKHRGTVTFNFRGQYPSTSPFSAPSPVVSDHPQYDEIVAWVQRAEEVNKTIRRSEKFVRYIIGAANTAGQLRTLFPEYLRMLPDKYQRAIDKMQKRSPLPRDVDEDRIRIDRGFVANQIAKCLLLPASVPDIWIN